VNLEIVGLAPGIKKPVEDEIWKGGKFEFESGDQFGAKRSEINDASNDHLSKAEQASFVKRTFLFLPHDQSDQIGRIFA
jgi:hypothetical protein